MIRAVAGTATHVGRIREGNEDSFLCAERMYFVADGMGGHSAGEVASDIAVTVLADELQRVPAGISPELVADAVRQANLAILNESKRDASKAGMGTTLTGLVVSDPEGRRAVVANVGDSRTYLWRHDELRQITKDHSHVQSLVDRGAITRAEARTHHQRNIVLRAMGIDASIDVDTFEIDIEEGDRFLICSDGLVDEADDLEIENTIRLANGPQDLADRLVALANDNGGRDNITVIVVDFVHADSTTPFERPIESIGDATLPLPVPAPRASGWLGAAAWASWLVATAIVVAVVISAITQG